MEANFIRLSMVNIVINRVTFESFGQQIHTEQYYLPLEIGSLSLYRISATSHMYEKGIAIEQYVCYSAKTTSGFFVAHIGEWQNQSRTTARLYWKLEIWRNYFKWTFLDLRRQVRQDEWRRDIDGQERAYVVQLWDHFLLVWE